MHELVQNVWEFDFKFHPATGVRTISQDVWIEYWTKFQALI